MAKPRRGISSKKKLSLESKWVHGTCVGMASRTLEHLIVTPGGGQVIRVRTVKRTPFDVRWKDEPMK